MRSINPDVSVSRIIAPKTCLARRARKGRERTSQGLDGNYHETHLLVTYDFGLFQITARSLFVVYSE